VLNFDTLSMKLVGLFAGWLIGYKVRTEAMLFLVWNYSYQRGSWLLGSESDVSHFSETSV